MPQHKGGCRCGAVRFEASADPFHVSYCHCGDCRRASGAPVAAFVGFRVSAIAVTGLEAMRGYGTHPVERRFCGTCGAPLFYKDARLADQIHLMLGAMDRPEDFPPTVHGYTDEQLPFLHMNDGLPRMVTMTVARPEGDIS